MRFLSLVLKGLAMGAANVIPGVSGGTIAFVTGIYERLINALKNIDIEAVKLLFTGQWKAFAERIDFSFLFFLFLGVGISIISLSKFMVWALQEHEALTFAFFFGLILASIIGVGKQITKWDLGVIVGFLIGTAIAVAIAFLPPASPNASFFYLMLCGGVAICSMILPGLSGSYVLLLMGNYALVLAAIPAFDFSILVPVMLGVIVGLALFSRLLSWLFAHFKNLTIALLTGFVAGSLVLIWPWKATEYVVIMGKEKATGYQWLLPEINQGFFYALGLGLIGFLLVWWLEKFSQTKSS